VSRGGAAWYAVDRDGFVGQLWPGLEGTVPRGARSRQRGAALREAIEIACVVRWLSAPDRTPVRPDALASDRMLFVLHAAATGTYRDAGGATDPLTALLGSFAPRSLRAQEPRIVVTDVEVDVASLITLLRDERVMHALALRDVAVIASRLGAGDPRFVLRHDDERDESPATYTVVRDPALPALHESEIPEPARTALRALRLPSSFADETVIDVEGLEAEPLDEALLPVPATAEPGAAPVATRPLWVTWLSVMLALGVVRMILRGIFGV
jgi:hypothetical protein